MIKGVILAGIKGLVDYFSLIEAMYLLSQ